MRAIAMAPGSLRTITLWECKRRRRSALDGAQVPSPGGEGLGDEHRAAEEERGGGDGTDNAW